MNSTRSALFGLAAAAAATALAGCTTAPKPQPLTPEAFISPRSATVAGGGAASGGDGSVGAGESARPAVAIPANGVSKGVDEKMTKPVAPPRNSPPAGGAGGAGSGATGTDAGQPDVIKPPEPRGSAAPTSPESPTGLPVIGASSGQYMTLGGVVAEVNGTPIYANTVLSSLDPILRQKARQMDATRFKAEAAIDIRRRIEELVRVELFYAAAQRTLDPDDKRLADGLTIQWRMQQITRAGGSVELAKRRAREENGVEFDDLVQEQSRNELTRIYEQKKIVPRIQVSAADIRDYYDRNVTREFSEAERVKFRLLKVDIKKTGSKEEALKKVTDKYKRAKAGEDFKEIAEKENDERMFATAEPLDMNPSSFSIAKVRDVLGKLQAGEVSEIIEEPGAFYVVKLEERKAGRVRPFEEKKVQDEIRTKLRTEQYRKLREMDFARLMKGAAIRGDEEMAAIALDMAMQRYAQYAAAK